MNGPKVLQKWAHLTHISHTCKHRYLAENIDVASKFFQKMSLVDSFEFYKTTWTPFLNCPSICFRTLKLVAYAKIARIR